jgi:phospholipid transport system transporter-binding protein
VRVDRIEPGKCAIEGAVSHLTARETRAETEAELSRLLDEADSVRVDLSRVTSSNSIMLSLMLSWLRQARAAGRRIVFERVPSDLEDLIGFTGLDRILPFDGAPAQGAGAASGSAR